MNERIKKLRKALGLTQHEFANRIGSVQNTITGYETGRRVPSNQVISLICREFNVNESWLRTGEGEMFVPKSVDPLEELVRERNLTHNDYILMEKFLALKPEARKTVIDYVMEVAAAVNMKDIPFRASPADVGQVQQKSPPMPDTRSIWEKEADEFAEIARQQYLAEKKRESGTLSVKKSGAG